jgi:hypothetical protein
MSIYWGSSPTSTPSLDLKHRLARARGKAKRRLLGVERHRQTGRYSLVYSPLSEPVEGYQATTLQRIEHALESIPIQLKHPKKRHHNRRRPQLDLHLNAEGRYA